MAKAIGLQIFTLRVVAVPQELSHSLENKYYLLGRSPFDYAQDRPTAPAMLAARSETGHSLDVV